MNGTFEIGNDMATKRETAHAESRINALTAAIQYLENKLTSIQQENQRPRQQHEQAYQEVGLLRTSTMPHTPNYKPLKEAVIQLINQQRLLPHEHNKDEFPPP